MFKATRKKFNLSQEQMGIKLKTSQDMISLMERGKRYPSFETLFNFYKEFGIENLNIELMEEDNKKEKAFS